MPSDFLDLGEELHFLVRGGDAVVAVDYVRALVEVVRDGVEGLRQAFDVGFGLGELGLELRAFLGGVAAAIFVAAVGFPSVVSAEGVWSLVRPQLMRGHCQIGKELVNREIAVLANYFVYSLPALWFKAVPLRQNPRGERP